LKRYGVIASSAAKRANRAAIRSIEVGPRTRHEPWFTAWVAYRRTAVVAARLSASRAGILDAALALIADGGYAAVSLAAVSQRAEVAIGTVYRHFPSKSALVAETFRQASERELAAVRRALDAVPPERPREAVAAVVEAFAHRALRGGRLAYALLVEPVDPAVEAERLAFRRAYRDLLAAVVERGVATGALPPQAPATTAAALVGAIGEALVGPLSPEAAPAEPDRLVDDLARFCVTALG
jgi:AcrR family transcriptional regulator